MAEDNTAIEPELDKDGKPVEQPAPDGSEGGPGTPPKIEPTDGAGEGQPTTPEPEPDIDPEKDVPVRQSVAQHIIARKNKTIEKLRNKGTNDGAGNQPPEEEEEPPQPSVGEEVDRQLKPIVETLKKTVDEGEIKDFLRENEDAKQYEKRIRVYMAHPAYEGVPPSVIYHHVAWADSQSAGAKKKRVADAEAAATKSGGRGVRPRSGGQGGLPTPEEMDAMSDKELEDMQHKIQTGSYK